MRLYRALLALYPSSFRRQYGAEMVGIFARRRREAAGPPAVAALWAETVADVLVIAAAAHWDVLMQDLRYAARSLGRAPVFAGTALVVVALGVGANTAVFSVTDYVLIRPLPFAAPDRLVKLWERLPGYEQMEPSPANYRDWKRMSTSFASMGAFSTQSYNLSGQGEPVRLEGAMVTSEVLPLLGVRPTLGRLFAAAEDRPGSGGTLLLGHRLWQEQFGSDRHVLGRRLTLDGKPFVVVGVMPSFFQFPNRQVQLWVPAQLPAAAFDDRNDNWLELVARLRPGVSLGQARAEMNVVAAGLTRQYPKENRHTGAAVLGLRDDMSRQSQLLLVALAGAALCVLLIACANLASLLIARSFSRRQELEVRTALGAGRERLLRQMVTENLVLALAGGGLGIAVAAVAVPLLARLVPAALPLAQTPAVDPRALAFAALLTTATGLGFGLAPALRACRAADLSGLRDGSRVGGGRRQGPRAVLVAGEVAVSVVLLVTSGLLLRALDRLQATDTGFRPAGVLTVRTALSPSRYPAVRRADFYHRVLAGARTLPGVSAARAASSGGRGTCRSS